MLEERNNRKQFSDWLPFYVNGTLPDIDREWMDAYLANHPPAGNELKFAMLMRESTKAVRSTLPEGQRLARLRDEWKQSQAAPSRFDKFKGWLQSMVQIPVPAMALASVFVVVQGAVIVAMLSSNSEDSQYRSNRPECATTPVIRVQFKPDAKHADILALLREANASIQSGPSETGALWLELPKDQSPQETLAMLQRSKLTEEVIQLKEPRLPKECTR